MTIKEMRKLAINRALAVCETKKEAAKVLGITEKTLYTFIAEQKGEAENLIKE
jgi:transcriptional regulator with PAS, ATPase and Fis domain